jgi:ubiquitin C-terminal hydrolase
VVSPRSFINNLNYKFSFEHEQQDSYELYHRLLELFETEDKNHNNPFSMKIKSIYKCDKCGNSFERIDDTLDLSLAPSLEFRSIEKLLFKFYNIPVKISDYICVKCSLNYIFDQAETCLVRGEEVTQNLSISSYLSILLRGNIEEDLEEVISKLDQYCVENNCSNSLNKKDIKKIKTNILKKSRIVKYPDILTIHLIKVFFENDAMTTNKIHVSFPEEMIIDSKKYHLTSFIEHWGLHSYGHYIAYRKLYNKWVKINDHKVNIIEKNEALKVGDPYMLFYRKVDQIN